MAYATKVEGEIDLSGSFFSGDDDLNALIVRRVNKVFTDYLADNPPYFRLLSEPGSIAVEVDLPMTADEDFYGARFKVSLSDLVGDILGEGGPVSMVGRAAGETLALRFREMADSIERRIGVAAST